MSDIRFRATAARPCPVCGAGSKGCSATADGLHFCRGGARAGWKQITRTEDGNGFHHYRREDEPRERDPAPRPAPKPARDWRAEAERCARDLTDEHREALATELGLPAACLAAFPLLGYLRDPKYRDCWTFPECDADGRVVALCRRLFDPREGEPSKPVMLGGSRGLYVPAGWRERPGPVLIPEGASDVLALTACGLSAVGRPNNSGGAERLADLLRGVDREIVVLGEDDRKKDTGQWPGGEGQKVADKLSAALNRPVRFALPAGGAKDARVWVRRLANKLKNDWPAVAREVLAHLESGRQSEARPECGEVLVESLSGITPKAVRYLVPDRIPAGMLGLLAGEGGHGKSVTTLHLAAAVTTGRCAFGLTYPAPTAGKVLLISCEDDWESTVVPRLAAFGADLGRVLRIRGVRMKADGQTLDFHLGHFRELERLLRADREINLVLIDPAGAYIGRSGVNENKDAELRTILGPLSETANHTGATILLVKHLNKSTGVSAVQRVSGSSGYVNAVRFAYMFTPDPDAPDRKLMLPLKKNVLKSGIRGLAYRVLSMPPEDARELLRARWPALDEQSASDLSQQLLSQVWEGETSVEADSAVARRGGSKGASTEECVAFIRQYLGCCSHPEKELQAAAEQGGFPFSVFKRAKAAMRSDNRSDPNRLSGKPRGEGGPWWVWLGPQGSPNPDRPNPDQSGAREAS